MENFFWLALSILGLVILLSFARERTKGKYLGYGFKWKPIPGYKWEPPVMKGLRRGNATANKLPRTDQPTAKAKKGQSRVDNS